MHIHRPRFGTVALITLAIVLSYAGASRAAAAAPSSLATGDTTVAQLLARLASLAPSVRRQAVSDVLNLRQHYGALCAATAESGCQNGRLNDPSSAALETLATLAYQDPAFLQWASQHIDATWQPTGSTEGDRAQRYGAARALVSAGYAALPYVLAILANSAPLMPGAVGPGDIAAGVAISILGNAAAQWLTDQGNRSPNAQSRSNLLAWAGVAARDAANSVPAQRLTRRLGLVLNQTGAAFDGLNLSSLKIPWDLAGALGSTARHGGQPDYRRANQSIRVCSQLIRRAVAVGAALPTEVPSKRFERFSAGARADAAALAKKLLPSLSR